MGTKPSEEMMELLKELALLKHLEQSGSGPNFDPAEVESRRIRREEITEQIKALGDLA